MARWLMKLMHFDESDTGWVWGRERALEGAGSGSKALGGSRKGLPGPLRGLGVSGLRRGRTSVRDMQTEILPRALQDINFLFFIRIMFFCSSWEKR